MRFLSQATCLAKVDLVFDVADGVGVAVLHDSSPNRWRLSLAPIYVVAGWPVQATSVGSKLIASFSTGNLKPRIYPADAVGMLGTVDGHLREPA